MRFGVVKGRKTERKEERFIVAAYFVVVTMGVVVFGDFEMEFENPGPRQDVVSVSEVRRR
jgi:hypothetical protein